MSVAFRRDSDEEHKEPRFELPIPAGPNLVTEGGPALIDGRIATLEAEQAEADEARREEIARDLRYWHTRRVTAIVAPVPVTANTLPPAVTNTPLSSRAVPAWNTVTPSSEFATSTPSIGTPVR